MNTKWLPAAGLIIVLVILFFIYRKYQVAPVIDFERLELVDLNSKKANAGTPGSARIITFGASWCSSCIKELNVLKEISSTTLKNVEVVVISDEQAHIVENFKARKQYPFTFLRMQKKFSEVGINSIPTTYLVNSKEQVIKETVGYIEWDDPSTVNHLLHLLQ
jgi:thiol-disulfide isomerase/thioredoxin